MGLQDPAGLEDGLGFAIARPGTPARLLLFPLTYDLHGMAFQVGFVITHRVKWLGRASMVGTVQLVIQWLYRGMLWTRPVIKAQECITPGSGGEGIVVVVMLRPTSWWAFSQKF